MSIFLELTHYSFDSVSSPWYIANGGNTGIGNMLFQIASAYNFALKYGANLFVPGLQTFFKKENLKKEDTIFRNISHDCNLNYFISEKPKDIMNGNIFEQTYEPNMILFGHFENYNNFHEIRPKILELFQPNTMDIEKIHQKYPRIIDPNVCSIHIRMGPDYKIIYNGTSKLKEYEESYFRCLDHMITRGIHCFFVFTNDKEYCFEILNNNPKYNGIEFIYSEERDYVDIWMISLIKNNIVSVSTLAWWGSYLNNHPDKYIIIPNNNIRTKEEYYCSDWNVLDFEGYNESEVNKQPKIINKSVEKDNIEIKILQTNPKEETISNTEMKEIINIKKTLNYLDLSIQNIVENVSKINSNFVVIKKYINNISKIKFGKNVVETLTYNIKNNIPFIFAKFGDGEWICANQDKLHGIKGTCNCDSDSYTPMLQSGLINSFKYIVNYCDNSYLGAWHTPEIIDYWNSIVDDPSKINWVDYHTFIMDDLSNKIQIEKQLELYKTIRDSNKKKIIICNHVLEKSKNLLNTENIVYVKLQNWFDYEFHIVLKNILDIIAEDPEPIIITSCGMSAKVLIAELHKICPRGTYVDMGSAMDFICTMRNTRKRTYNYNDLYDVMKPILPDDWHDPKYNYIYQNANYLLICP